MLYILWAWKVLSDSPGTFWRSGGSCVWMGGLMCKHKSSSARLPAALLSLSVLRLVTEPGAVLGGRPDLLHHIAGTVLGGYGSICRGDVTEPLSQLYLFRRCSDEKQPGTCSTEFNLARVPGGLCVTCELLPELVCFVRSLPGSSVWPLVLEWCMLGLQPCSVLASMVKSEHKYCWKKPKPLWWMSHVEAQTPGKGLAAVLTWRAVCCRSAKFKSLDFTAPYTVQ